MNLMLEDVQHLAGGLNQIRMEFWKNLKQFWMPAEKRGEEDMENKNVTISLEDYMDLIRD